MDLSLVVPTHDRPKRCVRLLRTVASEIPKVAAKIEVLVVDDGSPAHSFQLLAEQLPSLGEAFRLLQRSRQGGPSAARNSGIAASCGEIIVFLDDDCIPESDYLRQTLQSHRDYPEALVINGHLEALRDDRLSRFWAYYYQHAFVRPTEGRALAEIDRVSAGNLSIKRRLLDILNPLWDEDLPSREDFDLLLRLRRAGIPSFKTAAACAKIECRSSLWALWNQRLWYRSGQEMLEKKYSRDQLASIEGPGIPSPTPSFWHIYLFLMIMRKADSMYRRVLNS